MALNKWLHTISNEGGTVQIAARMPSLPMVCLGHGQIHVKRGEVKVCLNGTESAGRFLSKEKEQPLASVTVS